jgi:hypothetical protein
MRKKLISSFSKNKINTKIIFIIYSDLRQSSHKFELFETPDPFLKNDIAFNELTELKSLFETIKNLPFSQLNNVFVAYNRIYNSPKGLIDNTFILKLVKPNGENKLALIKQYHHRNCFQKANLLQLVFKYINKLSPSKKNLLFTWGHGSTFGIFKEKNIDEIEVVNSPIPCKGTIYKKKSPAKSFIKESKCLENKTNKKPFQEILSTDELAKSIALAFKRQKIDIILMLNCNMQNMFLCNSLKNTCEILIAPISTIAWPWYYYKEIINYTIKKPTYCKEELSIVITTTINNNPNAKNVSFANWAIFPVNLNLYPLVNTLLDEVGNLLMNKLDSNARGTLLALSSVASKLGRYDTDSFLADFGYFLLLLKDKDPDFSGFYENLMCLCNKVILPKPFISNSYSSYKCLTGISILFPANIKKFSGNKNALEFFSNKSSHFLHSTKSSKWMEFIQLYSNKYGTV